MFSQVPHSLLMVRPAAFGYNPETAASNAFQKKLHAEDHLQKMALDEFDRVVMALRENGIPVVVFEDTQRPVKTDAIFPNNWITTHEDGQIVLYPMMAPSRRAERRKDIVAYLRQHYQVKALIDLTVHEHQQQFLEGTGSIVFDHPNRIAYACRSPRTNEILCQSLCNKIGYTMVFFDALDGDGVPIYHTNVMLWIGETVAAICLDALPDEADQERVLASLSQTGHRIVALGLAQIDAFAGNMLEVKNPANERFLLMSNASLKSLLPGQLSEMGKNATLLPLEIPTIEACGGGSVRCMVAGIHLKGRQG